MPESTAAGRCATLARGKGTIMYGKVGRLLAALALASVLGGCSKCGWDLEQLVKPLPKSCSSDAPQQR